LEIIQYDYSSTNPTLGFGFWNINRPATLDTEGNVSISETIASPTITIINTSLD